MRWFSESARTASHPGSLGWPAAVFLATCLAASLPVPLCGQTEGRAVNIVMEDQFKNRRETGQHRGDVVLLVYAGRKGAEAAVDLGRRFHLRFHPTAAGAPAEEWSRQPVLSPPGWPANVRPPEVHVIPVACLPEVPKAMHAVARSRLRKESPNVSVWLDFDDAMRQTFGMQPDEPNVAIVDPEGRTHSVLTGHLDALRFEEVVRTVDLIRTRTAPGARTAAVSPLPLPR